jgi:ABC-2 type transport system permease protein
MTQEHSTYTVVVDSRPTRAGIDPYNKLIDRNPDDNMIDVEQ